MTNFINERKKTFSKGILTLVLMLVLFPLVSEAYVVDAKAYYEPVVRSEESADATTEAGANDINDIEVTMNEDGSVQTSFDDSSKENTWNEIFKNIKIVIVAASGIVTLVFVFLFLKAAVALGGSSGNPNARTEALKSMLWTFIAAGIAGSVFTVTALAWGVFK